MKSYWPIAGVTIAIAVASPVAACMVRPPQLSLSAITVKSVAIVAGTLSYSFDENGGMRGTLAVSRMHKGAKQASYSIFHDADFDPACENSGWSPDYSTVSRKVTGLFFLFRGRDGRLTIAKFRPNKG